VSPPAVKAAIGLLVFAAGTATYAGYGPIASSHLLAPPLHITCQSPDHVNTTWIRTSQLGTVDGGHAPGNTVQWLGWTEYGGCGQSLTITTGARP
jgi:hypothetical protein